MGALLAVSDLHVGHAENRLVERLRPEADGDWLIVAGDVGSLEQVEWALSRLAARFATVVWTPSCSASATAASRAATRATAAW